MSDWRALLREHDPASEAIEAVRVGQMRRAVLDTTKPTTRQASPWTWRFALVGAAVALLAAGAGDVGRMSGDRRAASLPPASSGERRQVQFDTPGGTRIIWEINPDFMLTETAP